ncbi:MAG TPA: hypothetical protein VK200_15115 [Candidatus Limnocylindrales bacterium]|nr:hypothetical protein [Candidatus Limnocylindrales bacterium]
MIGEPAQFEAIGNRLGFRVVEATPEKLTLLWQGPRFPAFLCLGIALLLLFISIPIVQALLLRGFVGAAGSLWYFPFMNLVLFGISIFLVTQRRMIEIDGTKREVTLQRLSLYRSTVLKATFEEIERVTLSYDQVASGFAVGGSTAAQSFPVPALRLIFADGENVLLDRGSLRRLRDLAKLVSEGVSKPLDIDPLLNETANANPLQRGPA